LNADGPVSAARAVIDSNRYMTLGTADEDGHPWVSPVWFAHSGYREFFWVSSPDARHSRNLAARPDLAIVIFDSQVPEFGAEAVYISASAAQLADDVLERGIEVFARKSEADGLAPWSRADVEGSAKHRLYRAVASEHYSLNQHDERVPVDPT
jgi:nitroimidazol reductase NimA-like FMN-containing flavoprotein (pyridoxamine 5'-phosphate oxidase superfamily)